MSSKFHKKAISRITPEARALMVKSLEIITQIHAILEKLNISQKQLATMLNISQPAVSKMLSPGGNLEINTVVKLELLLGETIVTTPQKNAAITVRKDRLAEFQECRPNHDYREVTYTKAELSLARICVN
jgi:predicted XRE-type DNA-binding protein